MAGPQVRALLAAQQGSFGASNTVAARAITAATAIHARTPTAPALSERELAVLTMLPSLLPLVDIAADLTVSVNTVKSHVRSIYAKLGVSSRRAAVLAAHENGLLTIAAGGGPGAGAVTLPARPAVHSGGATARLAW